MVQSHDGAVGGGAGELGPEIAERLIIKVPVVLAGDRGVEGDDPQATPPAGLVDRAAASLGENRAAAFLGAYRAAATAGVKMAAEGVAVIMVARQDDDARIAAAGGLGQDPGQVVVAIAVSGVRQVAGEEVDIRPDSGGRQQAQPAEQVVPRPDTGRKRSARRGSAGPARSSRPRSR